MSQNKGTLIGHAGFIALAALMLGQSSQGLAFTAFSPGLPEMAKTFAGTGHGMQIAQQAITIAAFGVIVGAFASGKIIDLIGSRSTILASLILFGVAGAAGMLPLSPWLLLASRVIVGFASATMITACINTISIIYTGNLRARAIGISAGMGSAIALIGMLLGGFLVQRFGWRVAFIQFPIFGAVGLLLALTGLKANPHATLEDAGSTAHVAGNPWPIYILAIVIAAVMFLGSSQLAFLLPQDGVTTPTSISYIMALITVIAVPVSFSFGSIEHRIGLNGALLLGLAVECAGLMLLGLVPTPAAAAVGACLMGIYVGTSMPYLYHAVTVKVSAEGRAKAIGMVGAFNFLGAFLNPFIFGPLGTLLGFHGTFLATGVFMGVLALVILFALRASPARMTPAAAPEH